jgi:hypothetical protein
LSYPVLQHLPYNITKEKQQLSLALMCQVRPQHEDKFLVTWFVRKEEKHQLVSDNIKHRLSVMLQ